MSSWLKKRDYLRQRNRRVEEASKVRKIVAIIISCMVLIIAAGAVSGYFYVKSVLEPVDANSEEEVTVEIPLGSSNSEISSILEENGIIKNSTVFRFYTKFRNYAEFQAGEYQLSPSMTFDEITAELKTGTVVEEPIVRVTIPEGKTVNEIAELLSLKANMDKQAFLNKTSEEAFIQGLLDRFPSILSEEILSEKIRVPLEGYLFAATYEFFEEEPDPEETIVRMLEKTSQVVTPYLEAIKARDLTVHEAITMASLVEKEATTEKDRKEIAGVFYNRLEKGMKLQTDPTVLYALGEHKDRVLYEDLEIESPYNTYYAKGLPPGPISNFGESSLSSITDPNDTWNMYFVASPDGTIYYSVNYEEHKEKTERYLNRKAADAGE